MSNAKKLLFFSKTIHSIAASRAKLRNSDRKTGIHSKYLLFILLIVTWRWCYLYVKNVNCNVRKLRKDLQIASTTAGLLKWDTINTKKKTFFIKSQKKLSVA